MLTTLCSISSYYLISGRGSWHLERMAGGSSGLNEGWQVEAASWQEGVGVVGAWLFFWKIGWMVFGGGCTSHKGPSMYIGDVAGSETDPTSECLGGGSWPEAPSISLDWYTCYIPSWTIEILPQLFMLWLFPHSIIVMHPMLGCVWSHHGNFR